SGVLVSLSGVRSADSVGIGEFADLPLLGQWCATVGLDLIQLLPVNDTGWQSSPYSALSAFALHPLHLRISDLPDLALLTTDTRTLIDTRLDDLRTRYAEADRLDYGGVLDQKTSILRDIFAEIGEADRTASELSVFFSDNPWVLAYAVFKTLKEHYQGRSWKEWSGHRDPAPELFAELHADPRFRDTIHFHTWVQMRLEEQSSAAGAALSNQKIMLKGDIPILINEDSADIWARRELFTLRFRAGAPPDDASPTGQNWDLPIYDWDAMRRDSFQWWKDRLVQAEKFYAAYRIDHVLGFFRVWASPAEDNTGSRGHFAPSCSVTRDQLHTAGFDDGRIRWLCEPHLPGEQIRAALGDQAGGICDGALTRIGDQDLFLFAPTIRGERDIADLECSPAAKDWLAGQFRDRALLRLANDRFTFDWNFTVCSRFGMLAHDEQERFRHLADETRRDSEELWESQGQEVLSVMRGSSSMLACAEDLGAIPACVPGVLSSLRIMGLRIPRWARFWDQVGQPYIPPVEYPFMSVCAPSVHDTSTVRGWWQEESDLRPFWKSLGLPGSVPARYTADTARQVIESLLFTNSGLCVFQLQDLLALVDGLTPADPTSERINVPGTVGPQNWSYRYTISVEALAENRELAAVLAPMVATRRRQSIATSR
ncbi:MAG: 4-alpha-glucanotransferase, partial [Spirochaetales bacterium]